MLPLCMYFPGLGGLQKMHAMQDYGRKGFPSTVHGAQQHTKLKPLPWKKRLPK